MKTLLSLAMLSFLFPSISFADISLSRNIIAFKDGDARRQNVTLYNQSKENVEFVKLTLQTLVSDANGKRKLIPEARPGKAGLLVTPSKLMLKPRGKTGVAKLGSYRYVRLSLLKTAGKQEKLYQVNATPESAFLTADGSGKKNKIQAGVQVKISYAMLISVLPKQPKISVSIARQGKKLTIKNTGNLYARFFSGKQCDSKKQCTKLPGRWLIAPEQTVVIDLPRALPVAFKRRVSSLPATQELSN